MFYKPKKGRQTWIQISQVYNAHKTRIQLFNLRKPKKYEKYFFLVAKKKLNRNGFQFSSLNPQKYTNCCFKVLKLCFLKGFGGELMFFRPWMDGKVEEVGAVHVFYCFVHIRHHGAELWPKICSKLTRICTTSICV